MLKASIQRENLMFTRILVALQNPQNDQQISNAALQLAKENNARILWLQILNENNPGGGNTLKSLHDQSMMWELESDTAQFKGGFVSILETQMMRWCPDLVIVSKQALPELMPLFLEIGNVEIYQLEPGQPWIVLTIPSQANCIMRPEAIGCKVDRLEKQFNTALATH
jgi:hypothetical protein